MMKSLPTRARMPSITSVTMRARFSMVAPLYWSGRSLLAKRGRKVEK